MADTLTFELVSPERRLAAMEASAVTIPGLIGDLTAMANHAPLMTSLRPGLVVVMSGGAETRYAITGGFAEVTGDQVSVLAEEGIEAETANQGWVTDRIRAFEKAHEDAHEDRKLATAQALADMHQLAGQLGLG